MRRSAKVADIISSRIQSFKTLAAENHIAIDQKLDPALPAQVELDENKIGQVLNNFLSNAIKFTPNGKITVTAFVAKTGEEMLAKVSALGMIWPGINNTVKFEANQLVMAVIDTGSGIPDDQLSKLFNKFTQLESGQVSEKKGTGLGLVISKGIIEAHDGKIGVFSESGHGSVFYFSIPITITK